MKQTGFSDVLDGAGDRDPARFEFSWACLSDSNMPTSPIPGPGLASRANSGSLHVDRLLHVYPALPYQASDPLSSPVLIRKPAPPLPFHPNKKQPAIAPLQIMAPHSKLLHSNAPSSDIELGAIGLPIPLHLELPGESIIELELPAQLQFPDSVQIQPERLEKDPKIDEPRAIPRLEIQDYSDLEILASAADLIESEANQPEPEPEDDGDWRKPKPSKSRSRKRKRAAKRYRDVAPDPEATIVPHDDPGSGEHQPENTEQIVATVNSGPGPNLGICTLADSELWKMFCEAGNEIVVSRPGRTIFPAPKFSLTLDPDAEYTVGISLLPTDQLAHKWNPSKKKWTTEPRHDVVWGTGVTMHRAGTRTGRGWQAMMPIGFPELRVTSDHLHPNIGHGTLYLQTFASYRIRLHVYSGAREEIFEFEETQFIALSHYLNPALGRLKAEHNPLAHTARAAGRTVPVKPKKSSRKSSRKRAWEESEDEEDVESE